MLAAVGVRSLFLLPATEPAAAPTRAIAGSDVAAEGFAESFAREYLTWDGAWPERHAGRVRRFLSSSLAAADGLQVPTNGRQAVSWTGVASSVRAPDGRSVTVEAQTNSGRLWLVVSVARDRRGMLFVSRYPALVGPPASNPSASVDPGEPVADDALVTVAQRALRNYLAGRRAQLVADLALGAVVVVPEQPVRLVSVAQTTWEGGSRVVVEVRVQAGGARLALSYALGVRRRAGRWFVASIESPSSREES
ncbi:MAG: conjugal transfer protein [Microbacteriaceae bacterium]